MNRFFFKIILGLGLVGITFLPTYAAKSASIYLGPVNKPVEVGKTFVVNVSINPNGASIDTARVRLTFDNNLISAVNASLGGSLDSPAPGNSINNGSGNISWGGFTVENPMTAPGLFARIIFKANAEGTANIKIAGDSRLISNGEEAGNPSSFNSISVKIVPAGEGSSPLQLSSPTHPNSDKWYQASSVQLVWNSIPGATYLWAWDRDPEAVPTQSTKDTTKTLRNVKSGIWYFHLQARLSDGKHTETISYRAQVDDVKPNPIEPYLDVNDESQLTVRFATTDYHSGVANYDLRVNQENIENAPSPYVLRGLNVGANIIAATAYDLAGNVRQGWVKFVLNSDGTIRDVTVSEAVCRLPFGCDTNGYILIISIPLVLLAFFFLYRRRVSAGVVVTPIAPGEQLITKTTTNPKGVYSRTSIHTHTHTYTDTDTYTDTAPDAPLPHPAESEVEKTPKKGSNKKPKKH